MITKKNKQKLIFSSNTTQQQSLRWLRDQYYFGRTFSTQTRASPQNGVHGRQGR